MIPDLVESTIPERLLALMAVLVIALITYFLARWSGRRLKGSTRLGLHGLERLAAPVTLLVIAASAVMLMVPVVQLPEVYSFTAEVMAIFAGFWLLSRALDVFWMTGEHSARLRHTPVARAALLSARHLGKVILWLAAAVTMAVKFGAGGQLYLLLGGIGAGLAFAARDPIRNALAFASMIMDPPFRLGDRIRMEEFRGGVAAEGTVLSISLSAVTIETSRHTHVYVSNVRMNELRVENLSVADRRRLELVVRVPSELSTVGLRVACDEIESDLRTHPHVSDTHEPHVWISGAPEGLLLKASLWLRQASDRRNAQRELLLLIRERFEQRVMQGREARVAQRRPALGSPRRPASV